MTESSKPDGSEREVHSVEVSETRSELLVDPVRENLGYKPELKRNFSALEVFGVGFTIMSIAPSVSSSMINLVPAGGAGMTWGWLAPCFLILTVATSMSEMSSAMPTAGGLYWWTYVFAPQKLKGYLSFLCGYSDALGMIAGNGSINYGAAQQLLVAVSLSTGYQPSQGVIFAVFLGICIIQCLLSLLSTKLIGRLQAITITLNVAAAFILIIALPLGLKSKGLEINKGSFVFGDTQNHTNYPYGMAFLLAWIAPSWAISGQDACVHLAEDARNPGLAIPIGLLSSIAVCSLLGFTILAVVTACVDPSFEALDRLINDPTPLASIISRALNVKWAISLMALFAALQIMMGLNCFLGTSRLVYAFARDDALPFSKYIKMTTKSHLPLNAFLFSMTLAVLISLLILAGNVAANAIFSLACSALYMAWCLPIFFYAFSKKRLSPPGPFYLGHFWSKVNAIIASFYGAFIIFGLSMLPRNVPVTNGSQMNYSSVLCVAVWGGATLYWLVDAHKWYHGPKGATKADELLCEVIEAEEWERLERVESSKCQLVTLT